MKEWATNSISVRRNTKNRLKDLGRKDDTYDDLIILLLDYWDKNHKKNKIER